MPRAKQVEGQTEALKKINDNLKVIESICTGNISIAASVNSDKKKISIEIDKKDADRISQKLLRSLKIEVGKLSKKYLIELDEEDEKILAMELVEPETKKEPEIKKGVEKEVES